VTYEPNGDDCPSDYSPNGKRLVITRASETTYELDTVKLDGSGLKRITPEGMEFNFCDGSWSPQGNQIVFSAHVPNGDYHSSVWVVHFNGAELRQLPMRSRSAPPASGWLPARLGANALSRPAISSLPKKPRSRGSAAKGSQTPRSARGCSSARAQSSTTCTRSLPSLGSARAVSLRVRSRATRAKLSLCSQRL
jgi:hypothetical protein